MQPLYFILLSTPQVVTYILLGALSGIATGIPLEQIGISSIIFETSKVALAYILIRLSSRGPKGATIGNIALMDLILRIFGKDCVPVFIATIVIDILQLVGLTDSTTDLVIGGRETIGLKDYTNLRNCLRSSIFQGHNCE